jgi:leucyl/phenylalanyl-tRNA--protein transferase
MRDEEPELNWEFLLNAYTNGYFPMAMSHEEEDLHWFYPEKRGIIPLDSFHIPQSLAKAMRKNPFTLTTNRAFCEVIAACGEINAKRKDTWINKKIIELYGELWERGYAHSVECWKDNILVGGLYGVAINGAFFGESMFSRQSNASRMALVHLVKLLKKGGYQLLDTQFVNEHLMQFGVIEIERKDYLKLLKEALQVTTTDVFD